MMTYDMLLCVGGPMDGEWVENIGPQYRIIEKVEKPKWEYIVNKVCNITQSYKQYNAYPFKFDDQKFLIYLYEDTEQKDLIHMLLTGYKRGKYDD